MQMLLEEEPHQVRTVLKELKFSKLKGERKKIIIKHKSHVLIVIHKNYQYYPSSKNS